MPRPRTFRSSKGVDGDGPGWSYSQFVIAIAVAVFFGGVCFAVGYVVAVNERPLVDDRRLASNMPPAKPSADPDIIPPKPTTKPESDSSGAAETKPEIKPPTSTGNSVQRPVIGAREIAPLPPPGTGPTPMVKTAVKLPKPDAPASPASATLPPTTPAPTAVAVEPLPAPSAKEPQPAAEKAPVPPAKPPEAKTPTAPSVARGSWGIQVAFFDGKERKKQAATVKEHLKKTANQKAAVLISADDKEYRVIIEGFPTPEAAKAACEKLKTKTGFADAWVKRLP